MEEVVLEQHSLNCALTVTLQRAHGGRNGRLVEMAVSGERRFCVEGTSYGKMLFPPYLALHCSARLVKLETSCWCYTWLVQERG